MKLQGKVLTLLLVALLIVMLAYPVGATSVITRMQNVLIDGVLQVTGAADYDSTLDVTGAVTAADTLTVTGATALNGGLTMDSTAFTVANTSGNTGIAGTLQVTGATTLGETYSKIPIITTTGAYPLTAAKTGAMVDNLGASGPVTITLPAAAAGLNFCFYVSANQNLVVDPAGTNQVLHLTNSGGDSITDNTIGDSVCLVSTGGSNWVPIHETGTWSDSN